MPTRRPIVTFDPSKDELNRLEHGWSLSDARSFEFGTSLSRADESASDDERRMQALGKIGKRVVFLVYIPTADGFRVISLRDATELERETWQIMHP